MAAGRYRSKRLAL